MKNSVIEAIGCDFGGRPDRYVRELTPDIIDEYVTIYLNAYPANKDLSEEGIAGYRQRYIDSMNGDKNINFCGLFEDDKLIALMKVIDFSMNAFGKMCPATGLMSLAVHPMHKKKGAGLDMVRFFERYTRETGAIVAMLLPFRMDFYRNMGYGYGSKLEEYRIPSLSLPKWEGPRLIRLLGPEDTEKMLECQKAFAGIYHGMVVKFEDEIRAMHADTRSKRIGCFADGMLKGYAVYDLVSESPVNYTLNSIDIKELVYLDSDSLRAILGFFREQADLAQTVTLRTGEEDFYHILPSAQDISGNYIDFGFLQTNVGAVGTMYKIVDPSAFVRATSHRQFPAAELTAAFDYYDELAHEDKTFAVSFKPSEDGCSSRWTEAGGADCDVRIKCCLADMSSLFMGSCRFSSMLRLGAFSLSDGRFCNILDDLFYCRQKPSTNTDY